MKIDDCQLFAYKYRTIGDKVKGASFSAKGNPQRMLWVFDFMEQVKHILTGE
jgi:hypothetical protein